MSLEESMELVIYAFKNGKQGDIFVQKSGASTIETLVLSLKQIFQAKNKIKIEKKIIAIGGVGISPESDEKLDLYILSHSKKTENDIGFLATASKDDEEKINKFYKRFENVSSELSHFNLCSKIDGFIADANKEREVTGAGNCNAHKTHLVGVLTLTSPFTITPQTYGLNFKFNLTGQGVQFVDTTGTADGIPDEFGSAPFSGTFEVLNQD